ncbi:hypothetical protein BD779DRAFT_1467893 [Infundibulicybe gibba]|nr:hypothetical protein BD779DRAFT_1467893 [Infundibulicybe gibba]
MPAHDKSPLVTLRLSSQSFLDAELKNGLTGRSLYTIKTAGPYSTIVCNDSPDASTKLAEIKWPKVPPPPRARKGKETDGVIIHMKGVRWNGGETLLKYGSFSSSPRKFNIPNFSQSLKWKRMGDVYWCVTSVVKGPIAIFTPASEFSRPQLQVFETLRDKYDTRSLPLYHGVSILLLDYLLITSMILVTDVREWMSVEKYEQQVLNVTLDTTPEQTRSVATPTSELQWRKIAYGEPLFRKRSATLQPAPLLRPTFAPTNNTYRQAPFAPDLDFSSDSEDDNDPQSLRSPSPSAESLFYPLTNSSAPSHIYLDPSFYGEGGAPPVPVLPSKYRESRRRRGSHASDSTAPSPLQQLESPPEIAPLSWNRSQSTPPESHSNQYLTAAGPSSASGSRRSADNRTHSMNIRRLPQPPTQAATSQNSTIRHVQSYSRLATPLHKRDKRSSYGQRSLPQTPTAAGFQQEGIVPAVPPLPAQHRGRKGEAYWIDGPDEELSGRVRSMSFEVPPPAYHSHIFDEHGGFVIPEDAGPTPQA